MRIGLDLRMFDSDYGIGRYSFELTKHILDMDRNHEYFLFVRSKEKFDKSNMPMHLNVTVVEADFRHYSLAEQIGFNNLLNKYDLDLVHFMNFNVPLLYKKPFLATIHDLIHHKLPGNKKRRFLHRLAYKAVIRHAAKDSLAVITVSEYSKRDILKEYNLPSEKVKVIYEAATPVPVSDSDVAEVMQKFNISKPYVVFVGVMERKKNILKLAEAFDILKEKFGVNIQLLLVGKEDLHYPEILNQARSIKYAKDLIVTGTVTDKEKYALYKGAQAFVSASLFEGFGLPGVEAMSLGVPLVVSNIEVFNEVYDNGAIYFDPNDSSDIAQKINFILSDSKYKQLIANNAYARSQYFSWNRAAKETIDLYNQCLK